MDLDQKKTNQADRNSSVQKRNIIEEINALNQRMQNPSNEIYKISSSWDKQPNAQYNKNSEIMIKEMINYIIKMDAVLTRIDIALTEANTSLSKIETALSDSKDEKRRETKSFWDNFHL